MFLNSFFVVVKLVLFLALQGIKPGYLFKNFTKLKIESKSQLTLITAMINLTV